MTDDKHRRQWMAMLGKMVAPMDNERAIKGLCDMLPLLVSVEDGYFSAESLAFIAGRCKRVPTFGELKLHFGAWWQENLPASQRLAADAYPALQAPENRGAPTEIEKHAVAEMVKAFKASTFIGKSAAAKDEAQRPSAHHLRDQQMLVEYEKIALNADIPELHRMAAMTRVKALRSKLRMHIPTEEFVDA